MAPIPVRSRWRGLRLVRGIERRVRSAVASASADPPTRIAASGTFRPSDIDFIAETFRIHGPAPGTPWDALRDAHLPLPDWFQRDLDPLGEAYAQQQHRLWQLLSGVERAYEAHTDEKEHDIGAVDAVRRPGYYVRRDPYAVLHAADHVIASGMILKHSALAPGDWALEYGPGFGQTALALARLGVFVDTVDISAGFCEHVNRQAEFFQVPLSASHGRFGLNPRPGQRYKLIWFYESFHHCLDFQNVILQLREHLAPGGRILLGGEPIEVRQNAAVPYPWGMRLHSEVVATVRRLHWFELGFTEDFLCELFTAAGFVGWRVDCEPSLFGRLHIFERRPDEIHFGRHWLPTVQAEQWGSVEADGRWAGTCSDCFVDAGDSVAAIEIDVANPADGACRLQVSYAGSQRSINLAAGERHTVRLDAVVGARRIVLRSSRARPQRVLARLLGRDLGNRGVFVRRLRYVAAEPSTNP